MPDPKVTPLRAIRVPDDEWREAMSVAKSRGESLTSVIRAALRRYVMRHAPK